MNLLARFQVGPDFYQSELMMHRSKLGQFAAELRAAGCDASFSSDRDALTVLFPNAGTEFRILRFFRDLFGFRRRHVVIRAFHRGFSVTDTGEPWPAAPVCTVETVCTVEELRCVLSQWLVLPGWEPADDEPESGVVDPAR